MTLTTDARRISEWALRPWVLAGLLGLAGLLVHLLTDDAQDSGIRMALAALIGFGALALAFTIDEDRWRVPAIFAALVGLVLGGLVWRATGRADDLAAEEYGIMAGIFAAGLSLPLFQAGFHRLRWRTSYADTHFHVWTDAISAGGALAFTGLSWLVLLLVGGLLDLVGIPLDELIDDAWFGWTYSGATFGAALGVLRNQLKIIGTLQSVVLTVFSLLAVPVALAVTVFLAAVLVSGPSVLWDATDSSTPILLAIAAGSFVLVNAVIRDHAQAMSANSALRIAARVLALGILPLTGFAAISMGARIDQHGLTPERLWGLAAIVVAVAYGLAYLVDSVRGWKGGWPERLRASNLKLAVGTAVYALLLALPILNFGSISTSSQLTRLQTGAVPVDEFDFDAFKWDFGEPGQAALERLARSGETGIAQAAKKAMAQTERPYRRFENREREREFEQERRDNLTISNASPQMVSSIEDLVARQPQMCSEPCRAYVIGTFDDGAAHVALVGERQLRHYAIDSDGIAHYLIARDGRLTRGERVGNDRGLVAEAPDERDISASATVEVRPYTGRQVYVNGKPAGEPFD